MLNELFLSFTLLLQPPTIVSQPIYKNAMFRDTTINYIILHADQGGNESSVFSFLRKRKDSYHYYITRSGKIYKWLDPKYKANHAGVSMWNGTFRMNDKSIGICLQNKIPQQYTSEQYKSLVWLILQLYDRFPDSRDLPVLGHSDVAIPRGRKSDPGKHFNWKLLYINLTGDLTNGRQ